MICLTVFIEGLYFDGGSFIYKYTQVSKEMILRVNRHPKINEVAFFRN